MARDMTKAQYDELQQISLDVDKLIDAIRAKYVRVEKINLEIHEDDSRKEYLDSAEQSFDDGIGALENATRNLDDIDVPE